jgi:pyruvate formate lyase activating enzyme
MKIGGILPFTTIEYPDCLAAVVFCQGCPWRCSYCHNPHLLPADGDGRIDWRDVHHLMKKRSGLLDAVVFSGGEPTMQPRLVEAILDVKKAGFLAGLQTSGAYPDLLRDALPILDLVTMDLKAPFEAYERITGVSGSGEKARASAEIILGSGVRHRFRTTLHPVLIEEGLIAAMTEMVQTCWESEYELLKPGMLQHQYQNELSLL